MDGGLPKKCPVCSDDLHSILNCDGSVKEICLGANGCNPSTTKCENACAAADAAKADAAIAEAIEKYGRSVRAKHRPVVYYLIAKALRKGAALK